VCSRGQKTAFEKWHVFGLILTYVLKTEWLGVFGAAAVLRNPKPGETLNPEKP